MNNKVCCDPEDMHSELAEAAAWNLRVMLDILTTPGRPSSERLADIATILADLSMELRSLPKPK